MGRCERPCKYRAALYEKAAVGNGCEYIGMTRKSRVKKVYELLGVEVLTQEALKMLEPGNCPCFEAGRRGRVRPLEFLSRGEDTSSGLQPPSPQGEGMRGTEDTPTAPAGHLPQRGRHEGKGKAPVSRRKFDRDEARRLYEQGLSNIEIAKRLGVSDAAISHWRIKEGLPVNETCQKMPVEALKKLHSEGLRDREIAERLGVAVSTVRRWRYKLGLRANR